MTTRIHNVLSILSNNKAGFSYVSLNILTTFIRFFKGFILMKYLTLSDLGVITLVTAVMGLFTMLQLGFLNGGYRIYSEEHHDKSIVNDIVYSYFVGIEALVIIGIAIMFLAHQLDGEEVMFAFLASIFGILLVLNNWIRNILIAEKKVKEVNRLNIWSNLGSLIFLFTVPFWGLYGALLVTFSIELIFYIQAICTHSNLLPHGFNYSFRQYKWVLSYGFFPFLSGLIITYNMQIETWSIASFISTEALGTFYLPRLYISLFLLIPTAVSQLFYPDAIKAYKVSDHGKLRTILWKYIGTNTAVSFLLSVITVFLMEPVISYLVPLHLVGVPFVWMILPGLVIYTIMQPLDLVFYASNILRPFLWASLVAASVTTFGLIGAELLDIFSLTTVAIVKSLFYLVICIIMFVFYMVNKRKIWNLT